MICGAHPVEPRVLNLREYMHLMGLPHDYVLLNTTQWNHVAQNVPTATARDWTLEVIKYVQGKLPSSGEKLFRQNNLNQTPRLDQVKSTKLF